MFPTTVGINMLNYGHRFPYAPVTDPTYMAIRKMARPMLIWNELGFPVIRDDGVGAVAVNAVQIALTGIRVQMRS